jgi:hypothetical protein
MSDAMALTEFAELLGLFSHSDRIRILLELRNKPKDVARPPRQKCQATRTWRT